jgi:hypothetical protein
LRDLSAPLLQPDGTAQLAHDAAPARDTADMQEYQLFKDSEILAKINE